MVKVSSLVLPLHFLLMSVARAVDKEVRVCESHDKSVGSILDWWAALSDSDQLCEEDINVCLSTKTFGATVDHITDSCAPPELNATFAEHFKEELDNEANQNIIAMRHELCSFHVLNTNPAADVGVMVCLCDYDSCNGQLAVDLDETVKTVIRSSVNQIKLPSAYIEEIDADEVEENQHLLASSTISFEITKVDGEERTRFASEEMGKLRLKGEQFALVRVAESGRMFKLTHGAMDMFKIAAILKGGDNMEDDVMEGEEEMNTV